MKSLVELYLISVIVESLVELLVCWGCVVGDYLVVVVGMNLEGECIFDYVIGFFIECLLRFLVVVYL